MKRIMLTILSVVIVMSVVELTLVEMPDMESPLDIADLGLALAEEYLVFTLLLVLVFQLFRKRLLFANRLATYLVQAALLTLAALIAVSCLTISTLEKGTPIAVNVVTDFLSYNPDYRIACLLAGFLIPLVDTFFSKQTADMVAEDTTGYERQPVSPGSLLKWLLRSILKLFFAGIAFLLMNGLSLVAIYNVAGILTFTGLPGYAVIILLVAVLYFAFLIISLNVRMLIRTFPLRANGSWRRGVIVLCMAIVAVNIVCFSYLLFHPETLLPATSEANLFLPVLVFYFFTVYTGTLLIFPILWLLVIHIRCRMRRGILYLRKFNGKGDIAIMAALLRNSPAGTPVTFIVSPGWNAGTWDPIVLIFAGFKWYKPWSQVPLYLQTEDRTWQSDIRRWIGNSQAVVIDVSDLSGSVEKEISFIDEKKARHKTIALRNDAGTHHWPTGETQTFETLVPYRLSWKSALPRILLGLIFIIMLAAAVTWVIEEDTDSYLDVKVFTFVFVPMLTLMLLFLRPSLSVASEKLVKAALRRVPGMGT